MIETPPADLFLDEIGDINTFIADVLACPKRSSWHWPSFYLMYVEVDRMLGLLTRVGYHFASPFGGLGEPPAPEESAQGANALFDELAKRQKDVVRWLFQMLRYTRPCSDDPGPHLRLEAHVHPKSGWIQVFVDAYRPGLVSSDGKTLTRTVLPVARDPHGERIDHVSAFCMLRQQQLDLEASGMREALAQSAHAAAGRLGRIAGLMHAHLVEHCTIHDLMHPSSR